MEIQDNQHHYDHYKLDITTIGDFPPPQVISVYVILTLSLSVQDSDGNQWESEVGCSEWFHDFPMTMIYHHS